HFDGHNPPIHTTMPNLLEDLLGLRQHCLKQLTTHLVAMPAFWWVLRHLQPGRITDFAESFVEVHPLGLNDVANRLKLLAGLGAIQRLPNGSFRLTSFGSKLADQLAEKPDYDRTSLATEDGGQADVDFGVFDFGSW
ncbi:MAG TPA: hypothetical protein PKE64_29860, partial [Anaerolineae bacterium]|nr:hypothetical protein [Anaerolineae bacterium]